MVIGTLPAGTAPGSVNETLDADDFALTATDPTLTVAPFKNRPLTVTLAWGAPEAGDTLVTRGAVPPAWKRGSLGGTRRTTTTFPPDSLVDLMHGAGNAV